MVKPIATKMLDLTLPPLPPVWQRLLGFSSLLFLALAIGWLPLRLAVGLVIVFLVGLGLLLNPVIAVYLLIPLIPFSSLVTLSLGGLKLTGMEVMLAVGWGGILLQQVTHPATYKRNELSAPLLWPFLIFLSGIALSWLNALSLKASFIETAKWIEMLLLYLWLVSQLPIKELPRLVGIVLLTGVVQAALGLYQFVFKVGPEGFLLFGGRFLRAYGTFGQPNPYAGYLGLILPLAVALAWWKFDSLRKSANLSDWNVNFLATVSLSSVVAILLAALFATQSRSGWIAAVVAVGLVLVIMSRLARLLAALSALLATMLGLAGALTLNLLQMTDSADSPNLYQIMLQRLVEATAIFRIDNLGAVELTDANFATLERLAHWQAAWDMWRDNFWVGVGFGNYELVYPMYAVGQWLDPLGHAHNYLFNLGAETGFIGLCSYVIFWLLTFALLWQTIRHSEGFYHAVAVGGLGIMVHLHLHNLFDNLYVQGMYLHIVIILAFVSIIGGREAEAKT